MKRVLIFFLILVFAIGGLSCATQEPQDEEKEPAYKDGTYIAKLSPDEHGNFSWVKLIIEDGKIADVDYREYIIAKGVYKTEENYPDYPQSPRVQENLEKQLIEKQDLEKIDLDEISGATHTKQRFEEVVKNALNKAEEGEKYKPKFKDGEYEAQADEPAHGWLAEIWIKVEEGMLVGVDYNEINVETKQQKSHDNYEYDKAVDAQGILENTLIKTQDVDKVDKVSGATNTTNTFKDLAKEALTEAKQ